MVSHIVVGISLVALLSSVVACAAPGDDCADPLVVTLPAQLPFADLSQHTCGRGADYDSPGSCIAGFAGHDLVYELRVTAPLNFDLEFDPHGTRFAALALDATCPPTSPTCLAYLVSTAGEPLALTGYHLEPGIYTLLIDCWVTGGNDCIPTFDLAINACTIPVGACCTANGCLGTIPQLPCLEAAGMWFEGFNCITFACPDVLSVPPDTCPSALPLGQPPYSVYFTNSNSAANGPPGSCNAVAATQMCNDVWFTYAPLDTGTLTVDVAYYWYDGLCAVYAGSDCTQLTEISCTRAGEYAGPHIDTLTLPVSAGELYWLQIGDYGVSPGGGETLVALRAAPARPGDVNCDAQVDFGDINAFVLLLANRPAWEAAYAGCPPANGDINADGAADFGDINPFVMLLVEHAARKPAYCI